jgi:uncharacterized Zn finger protein
MRARTITASSRSSWERWRRSSLACATRGSCSRRARVVLHPATPEGWVEADVRGTDVTHRVRLGEGVPRCTCPWFAKHQGDRGPCKHVLAAQLAIEAREDEASS